MLNEGFPVKPFTAKTLSTILFGQEMQNIHQIDEKLASRDKAVLFASGQDDLFETVDTYGGEQNSMSFNNNMMKVKSFVLSQKPQPEIDEDTGKATYRKYELEKFYKDMTTVTTPMGFVEAVKKERLTREQFLMFSKLYPNFLSKMVVSVIEGLRTGKLKKTPEIEYFLKIYRNKSNSTVKTFYMIDKMNKMKNEGDIKTRKQWSKVLTTPSTSDVNNSGIFGI